MLFAVLFDSDDQLVAAAPACDQIPYGDRYWTEMYPTKLSYHTGQHTGYMDVVHSDLLDRLKVLPHDPTQLAFCSAELERLALAGNVADNYFSKRAA